MFITVTLQRKLMNDSIIVEACKYQASSMWLWKHALWCLDECSMHQLSQ